MIVYILNLILSCLICSRIQRQRDNQRALGMQPTGNFGFFLLFTLWVCLYTFRYKVGSDSWTFNSNLQYFLTRDVSFVEYASEIRDTLFATIYYFCFKIVGMKRVWFYMVEGILTYFPIIQILKERDEHLTFSVFIYCTTLACYSGYNGTRQAIAVGFIMLAYYKYFLKGQYKKYALVMLIAFGFHSATLFALPFHLLSKKRTNSAWIIGSAIILLGTVIFLRPLWSLIINFLDSVGQTKMANDYSVFVEKGANVLRLFVGLVPLLMVLANYQKVITRNKNTEPLINLSIFGNIFLVFMMRYALFARVVGIIDISGLFLLPKIPSAFEEKGRDFMYIAMIVLYLIYMVLILLSGDSHLYPYQFLPYLDATW